MDLLQEPELSDTYDKCKYKVKLWENQFKKKNGRLPSKLDIREASREVRNAYRTYFRLKTAALEESLMHIDGFDAGMEKESQDVANVHATTSKQSTAKPEQPLIEEKSHSTPNANTKDTWGLHLNKSLSTKSENKQTEKLKVNLSFTQKIFESSKSSKRVPRKSLSFNRKKSESDCNKSQFLSQPEYSSSSFLEKSEETSRIPAEDDFKLTNVKTVTPAPVIMSQTVNLVQSVVNNNYNSKIRTVDPGWIKRVTQHTGNELLNDDLISSASRSTHNFETAKVDYDSDDIIANSEDEDENSCSLYHIAKKRRMSCSSSGLDVTHQEHQTEVSTNTLLTVDITPKRLNFSNIFPQSDIKTIKDTHETETNSDTLLKNDETCSKPVDPYEFELEKQEQTQNTSSKPKNSKAKLSTDESMSRKSERVRKTLVDLSHQSDTENEDPFHSDNDDGDPEFKLENDDSERLEFLDDITSDKDMKKVKAKSKTKKDENAKTKPKKSKAKEQKVEPENSVQTYELEYSVKSRIVTVPRIKNIKQTISKIKKHKTLVDQIKPTQDSVESTKSQKQRAEEKLKKKIESGSLNDNFVQINLKKKIYARGKNTKTFSKYKKQQWKNKKKSLYGPDMDMGGCDGGMLTCFNCGQVGHFARACKLAKSDALLPLANEEEVCSYPTLEEAAKMAQESVLAIRKPNQIPTSNKSEADEAGLEDELVKDNKSDDDNDELFDDSDDDLLAETERLEQEIAKIDVQNYIDSTVRVKPYYDLKEDGTVIEPPQEIFDVLEKFGHSNFRSGQERAIMRILSGQSTLVTLSTGSGKSLCYQLPAYLYSQREPCISLIISPLVSLMEDQVAGIPGFLKAACLHTNQTKTQRGKIMEAITLGNLNILLVSPEAVVAGEKSSGFGSLLRKLPPIAFACIDEAHCVSQWSHNFRPSYLKICRVLREQLGINTVLGLTATATRATSDSIITHLSIPDGRDGIITDIPLPDNLHLTVSRDVQRDQALLALLLSERFSTCKSIIVYCTRREECQRVATFLRTCLRDDGVNENENKKRKRYSLQAEAYHAGLPASRRKTIQNAFMNGELRIVVATVAFGMGINKSDIRAVIHYNMPMSFESYVQEVGRAGRDGLPAHCHLFLDSQGKDENELRRHIFANSTDRHVIRKLLQRCFVPCSCKTACPRHEVAFSIEETVRALDIPEENIETLLCYLELHDKRHIQLLSHAYVTCKIISYAGPNEIRKAAKECPPLAMALALHQKTGDNPKQDNIFEFPVVDVASAMGWDSGICKHKLKNLEWITENRHPKRSKLNVQFSNLGFRLLAPGNLSDSELDETLDTLYERVKEQERTALLQLHAVHTTLISVASPNFKISTPDNEQLLKSTIREYFESPKPLELLPEMQPRPVKEEQIVADVRSLVAMYRDNSFTGRAVARIFHGIQSPNYPAFIWGRCKFWRVHMGSDFNTICKIATREILHMR